MQAYLDGELPVFDLETSAAHIATCAACGAMARELEAEIFALSRAFEPELTLPVPTAQLRARVNAAVDQIRAESNGHRDFGSVSFMDRLRAWTASLTPQAVMGFATALVVVGVIGWFAVSYMRSNDSDKAIHLAVLNLKPEADLPAWQLRELVDPPLPPIRRERGTYVNRTGTELIPKPPQPLPSESTYMDTIAQMNHSMAERDDLDVRPTLRADIERNMAVLDQAIATSQEKARRNPKDQNAVAFLNAAYQNKIEFLRTVSDQAQLYAALR
jgi:hypothetical protein